MKIQVVKPVTAGIIGLLLSIPTAWFIFISYLKYELGRNQLFDATEPLLVRLGIQENFGWNINLLIVFGPVLALLLNVLSILQFDFQFTKERIDCQFSITKSWKNLAVIFLSGVVMLILCVYFYLENCHQSYE